LNYLTFVNRVSKSLLNPNQKMFENIDYPNKFKVLKLALITLTFVCLSIAIITGLTAPLNAKYEYLKTEMECMQMDHNDYTTAQVMDAPDEVVS